MPYRDRERQKESNREAQRKRRQGMTGGMTNNRNVIPDSVIPKKPNGVMGWPPSKFLSPEEDARVQENVKATVGRMKTESPARYASFRNLAGTFTPSIQKEPALLNELYRVAGYRYDTDGHAIDD